MGSRSNSSHSKMKAVIILGALALVLVSGLELNEEESQLSLSEGTLQREARDAQPGRKRRGKKGSKKGKRNGAAKRKSKGKKKKGQGRRANKKVGKGRNNRRNNKKKGGNRKMNKSGRQSTECLADVVTAIKGYRSAGNQKRMAMRISAWKKNMGKKKDKAATQFGDAADSLDAATGGGQ